MTDFELLSDEDIARIRKRLPGILRLQEIAGNPLTADEIKMFEMFDRERWPHEVRLAYIMDEIKQSIARDPSITWPPDMPEDSNR